MDEEILRSHFQHSGFDDMQADALASYFKLLREEVATKQDLNLLRTEMRADAAVLRSEMEALRSELKGDMAVLRSDMRTEIADLKGELTWRFVALTVLLATVMTVLNMLVQ